MLLPVDFRKAPFKTKYVDEETPMFARWMVFGSRADGTVDVCSGDTDVFEHVPPAKAIAIVKAREAFVDAILVALNQ